MRKLKTKDIPAFCRLLKDIGAKEEIKRICAENDSARDAFSAGFDLIYSIMDLATGEEAEQRIYEFFAPIFERAPEEIAEMELAELSGYVDQLARENDLSSFFGSALKVMK